MAIVLYSNDSCWAKEKEGVPIWIAKLKSNKITKRKKRGKNNTT